MIILRQNLKRFNIKHEDIDEMDDGNLENQNIAYVSEPNLSEGILSEILKQVNELCDNIKNGDPDTDIIYMASLLLKFVAFNMISKICV